MPKPFLEAEWRNLLMANFPIDPNILQPHLPCHTELDDFEGTYYVSLVGFLFANTKVMGISYPFHRTFEEVNLRFYVRYKEDGKWKRGVVFLKEIVPRRMISFIANTIYGENYTTLPMCHSLEHKTNGLEVSYSWKVSREWNYIKVLAEKDPVAISEGSIQEFITEHYWGYTFIDDTCSGSYEVQHPRWKVHNVMQYEIVCHAEKLYGASFAEALRQEPTSVFLAEGSAISVMKKTKIFAS